MELDPEYMADPLEAKVARDALERYSGSAPEEFGEYVLLTNFSNYVKEFSEISGQPVREGGVMLSCHWPEKNISILDFKVGSPAAALAIDLLAFTDIKGCLMLGMCGGLRRKYNIGDYLLPVAAIRGEGTSDFYFPPEVPALTNFVIQRALSEILDREKRVYHIGIVHSTNIRFWEFNDEFRRKLIENKVQGIEMECATLFSAGYKRHVYVGALLLISDLPLKKDGIKTKEISAKIKPLTRSHVLDGIAVMEYLQSENIHQKD
jgi:AMP nucleosidase